MKTRRTPDQIIAGLRPGQESPLTRGANGTFVTVERSGDGKTLRFIRYSANGSWRVFRREAF